LRASGRCATIVLCGVALAPLVAAQAPQPTSSPVSRPVRTPTLDQDLTQPPGLPALGKWMLDASLQPAHWLGGTYRGKRLREPINVILLDQVAGSAEEAEERLLAASKAAGYESREGHSAGYHGIIAGIAYAQLPAGKHRAFSNEPFELTNNHGRIFGPNRVEGGWLFIGAFSREKVESRLKTRHWYVSFGRARDDFARRLHERTEFKFTGLVPMRNALSGDGGVTTGDHDGFAVMLVARK
jgi:hypothetical protein